MNPPPNSQRNADDMGMPPPPRRTPTIDGGNPYAPFTWPETPDEEILRKHPATPQAKPQFPLTPKKARKGNQD